MRKRNNVELLGEIIQKAVLSADHNHDDILQALVYSYTTASMAFDRPYEEVIGRLSVAWERTKEAHERKEQKEKFN